jgi:hypothetical protein
MSDPKSASEDPAQPAPPPWRAGIDPDRRRRSRRPSNPRESLRRLTVTAAIAAVTLNGVLFVETAATTTGPDEADRAILALISTLFPGSVRPPNETPVPTPSPAVAVSGAS